MKKVLCMLLSVFLAVGFVLQTASSAQAQFTKIDATKTPSKLTNWFQTQKAKCEKIMESVQTSQFGQFVGDGIKYTKEGIKFALPRRSNTVSRKSMHHESPKSSCSAAPGEISRIKASPTKNAPTPA